MGLPTKSAPPLKLNKPTSQTEKAWNELAIAQEYAMDNDVQTLTAEQKLENIANAERHINRALLQLGLAAFKLQNEQS